jgi:hypothetical protein
MKLRSGDLDPSRIDLMQSNPGGHPNPPNTNNHARQRRNEGNSIYKQGCSWQLRGFAG